MAVIVRTGASPMARRPGPVHPQPAESTAVLAALMFVMVLIGFAAWVLAAQATRPPAAPNQRPVEGWVGTAPGTEAVGPVEPSFPVPMAAPTAPPPVPAVEPVRAEPVHAAGGRAQVANTAGLGVVLHTEPRRGARTPAGLLEGTPVTLLEFDGAEWARVRSVQGRVGWVPTAYLAPGD